MGRQQDANLDRRIATWKRAFSDETTGIRTSLENMFWDHAAFRTAIKIGAIANERGRQNDVGASSKVPNRMLFDLLARGYWSSLLIGTRKLVDNAPLGGNRGVYSLTSVLEDVRACQSRITRRVYVEKIRDCRYDLRALQEENYAKLTAAKGRPIWGDPELLRCELSHRDFDDLSGVDEAERSELDLIDLAILDKLKQRLIELEAVRLHTDTHLAHAGNVQSRLGKDLDEFDIRDARRVLKSLVEMTNLVARWFAGGEIATLAVFQGDQFEGLDAPLVRLEEVRLLEENWAAIDRDISSWALDAKDLLQ